jgi:hypothetical protein
VPWITTGEAFRRLFRALYPEHATVANEISNRWSLNTQSAPREAAWVVAQVLLRYVNEGHLRLLGERDDKVGIIPKADCEIGLLDAFGPGDGSGGMFEVGDVWQGNRIYQDVRCDEYELERRINLALRGQEAAEDAELTQAPPAEIRRTIRTVYDEAEGTGADPPNIKRICDAVLPRLQTGGFKASKNQITKIAGEDEFRRRRRPPGRRSRKKVIK